MATKLIDRFQFNRAFFAKLAVILQYAAVFYFYTMLKKHGVFAVCYLIIILLNLFSEIEGFTGIKIFVKPLICISLAFYLFLNVNFKAGFNRLVFSGLIFSLFGDIFLLFASSDIRFFIYGLISFLLAHIFYSLAFLRDYKNDPQQSKRYGHIMLFFMGVFSLGFYTFVREYLGEMRIPVMLYIFFISVMAVLTGYRYLRVNLISFQFVIMGAICFVISDSVLAYNKFVQPLPSAGIIIMAGYMAAQYLLTMGVIERVVVGRKEE